MSEADRRRLFRQAFIDQNASQERLDVLAKVTGRSLWIALSVTGALLAAAVLWGLFGSVPIKVAGEGILVRGGEIKVVPSPAQGTIDQVLVKLGDVIRLDQPVAVLSQAETERALRQKQEEQRQEQPRVRNILGDLVKQRAGYIRRLENIERLIRLGIKTPADRLPIWAEIGRVDEQAQQQRARLLALEQEIQRLQGLLRDSSIRAKVEGRVIDIAVSKGSAVGLGSQILRTEPPDASLQATVFVPAGESKRVRAGMRVLVALSHIKPEENGYLLARVASISPFSAPPEVLKKQVGDSQMVDRMIQKGPQNLAVLDFEPDPGTPSGYRWTGKGAPSVDSGSFCSAQIIVERRCPLSYLLHIPGWCQEPG